MSSQGSSSVRVCSRATFAPMSGDPLYREVSEPSTSSTKSTPEVASRPMVRRVMELAPKVASRLEDGGAMEPAQKVASISGRQDDEEVEEVAVSCGDLQSLITSEDYTRITQEYGLEVLEPNDLERLHASLDGYMTLSKCYLQFGLRFPLNPFFVEVLKYFGLTVFHILPNGWAHMIGHFGLFMEHGMGMPWLKSSPGFTP